MITNETYDKARRWCFRLLGNLGALDPYLMKKIQTFYQGGGANDDDDLSTNLPFMQEIRSDKLKSMSPVKSTADARRKGSNAQTDEMKGLMDNTGLAI